MRILRFPPCLRLASPQGALALAGALTALAIAFWLDEPVRSALRTWRWEPLIFLARFVSHALDALPVLGGLAGVACVTAWLGRRRTARLCWVLLLTAALCGLTATLLRSTTGRVRPNVQEPKGWYGMRHNGEWLMGKYAYNSFPSGHTATVAGAAVALALARPRRAVFGLALLAAIGASRLYLGAHHLSDVVMSLWIGFVGAAWIWHLTRNWSESVKDAGTAAPPEVAPLVAQVPAVHPERVH